MAKQKFAFTAKLKSNRLRFSDKSTKNVSLMLHDAVGASGNIVEVTYKLEKSAEVEFMSLSIGYTFIDLEADMDDADPNVFKTKDDKTYACLFEKQGLQIVAFADGDSGGYWKLSVFVDGTPLQDNPIKKYPDANGRLDHNQHQN